MIFNGLHTHRLERPRADVQRHKRHLNAFFAQRGQQRIVKVQTCGWRGNGPRFFTVDRLIQLTVGVFIRAVDVWRQRHMADRVEDLQNRARVVELNFKQRAMTRGHGGVNAFVIAQQQFRARFRRFGSANMRQNAFVIQHPLNQHFNLAAAGFTAKQTRRDHPGVVKDQQIARVELIEQIGESTVRQRARRPVQ